MVRNLSLLSFIQTRDHAKRRYEYETTIGPHWWEASALTTVVTKRLHNQSLNRIKILWSVVVTRYDFLSRFVYLICFLWCDRCYIQFLITIHFWQLRKSGWGIPKRVRARAIIVDNKVKRLWHNYWAYCTRWKKAEYKHALKLSSEQRNTLFGLGKNYC